MVIHDELQATCSGLGYHEGSQYIKEPDCLESVKELIRFLRREDDTCDIRRYLGHAQILQTDLLPLVKQHHDDKPLFDTVIRLLVNLTQPMKVCFDNQIPDEKTLRQHCIEVESHLQQYKEAFADEELFTVLAKKMSALLELDWEHRREEDKLMLERLIVLVRNVLHIPPDPTTEQRTDDDASLHDQILWAIHVSGMEDLILYIASSEDERNLCMHILEIVSLMFREQSPEILALAGVQRSMSEKEKDERELELARQKEKAQKKQNLLKFSTRHSNFGGTYVMLNNKSLSDKDLIYHKPIQDADNFTLDTNKKRRKAPRNRQPIKDVPVVRRSTLSIRLGLKEFCVQFLENAYNPLMYAVKDNLVRETTQDLDETYYMWAMQFFMEFCRHHSGHVDFISETMSVPTFHYIYNNLLRYYEMIMVEKKEAIVWGRRVHLALRAYQELLMTLDMMDRSKNKHLQDSARVIKSNVFYMMEFRDIFVTLLKRFDQTKNSRAYLKDLVETTHLFLRMLEKHTKTNSHLVVQGNKRKSKKKTKRAGAKKPTELTETQLDDLWDEVSSELSAYLQGREPLPEGIAPFDAASEVDVDQQRVDAMVRIHTALRNKQAGEAVAIFRAAREVWPEQNEFGSQDITAEEEFMALREIFMAPLPGSQSQEQNEPPEEEENLEAEEEEVAAIQSFEQEFNFTSYLHSFAKPEILKAYVLLAADFEKNSSHTNHCVAKMLHRVGFDLGYTGMLFHASLFRVFQRLVLGPHAKSPRFQELYKFAIHVVRKFAEVANTNKKVYMEMLFWKGNKEAMQITEGYSYNPGGKVAWTEHDENELIRLFEDFRDSNDEEKDVVDMILERWTGEPKSRMQIIRQLKNLHLIESAKDIKKKKAPTFSREWTDDDEEELARLYTEFKHSSDPLGNILNALSKKRSKQKVTEKLLAMGFVNDRKELHKKRGKKGKEPRRSRRLGGGDSEEEDGVTLSDLEEGRNLPSEEEMLSSGASGDESSSDSSGDEADDDDGDEPQPSTSEPAAGVGSATGSGVVELLQSVTDKGYKDQVTWIQRLLTNCANNREKDSSAVSVPIVPLTEDNETAMEDEVFMEFLEAVGLARPSNEGEMFWRIPASLTVADLRNICEGLTFDDEGKPAKPEILSQIQQTTSKQRTSKEKKKDKKDKSKKKKKDRPTKDKTRKDGKKTNRGLARAENHKSKTDKRKSADSDSDSDMDDALRQEMSSKKTKHKMHDSSESENETENQQGVETRLDDGNSSDGGDLGGKKSGSKLSTAAERRAALAAMLERRKGKKVANRDRSNRTRENNTEEQSTSEEREGDADGNNTTEETPSIDAARDAASPAKNGDVSSASRKSRKRVKRIMMDSDSDRDSGDDRLVIDENSRGSKPSPRKPASKRARLLDSDQSDDDKENMDTSILTFLSDDERDKEVMPSQAESLPPLDFGDSSDEDMPLVTNKKNGDQAAESSDKTGENRGAEASQSQSQSQSQPPLDFGDTSDEEMPDSTKKGDNKDESDDDDVPLTAVAKAKAAPPESFPATLVSQGPPASDDSDLDDHVPLGKIVKRPKKIISDDEDD